MHLDELENPYTLNKRDTNYFSSSHYINECDNNGMRDVNMMVMTS